MSLSAARERPAPRPVEGYLNVFASGRFYRTPFGRRWLWPPAAVLLGAGLGLMMLALSPTLVAIAAVGAAFMLFIARVPEAGILTIVLLTSGLIDPALLPQLPFGPFDLNLPEVLLLFQVALVLAQALAHAPTALARTPLLGPGIWFLLAMLLSSARAVLLYSADLFFVISRVRIMIFYAMFFVITGLVTTPQQVRRIVGGLHAIAVAVALVAIAQTIIPSFPMLGIAVDTLATAGRSYEGVLRVSVPGTILVYVMFCLSVSSLVCHHRPRWGLGLLRTVTLGAALLLAFERNIWLTLVIAVGGLSVLVGWRLRLRMMLIGVCAAGLVVLAASTGGGPARYVEAAGERFLWGTSPSTVVQDRSVELRVIETGHALQTIRQDPLLGIGVGRIYRPPVPEDTYWRAQSGRDLRYYVHNAYLWVMVKMGIVGLAPFVLFYALAVGRGLWHWRGLGTSWQRCLVVGIAIGLAGQMVSNVVSPNMIEAPVLVIYPVAIGITEVVLSWRTVRPDDQAGFAAADPQRGVHSGLRKGRAKA